jgi:uncharacterized protein (DUF2147 family)
MRHDLHPPNAPGIGLCAVFCGVLLGLTAGAAGAAGPPIETGVWINHTGKGAVEIRPCAASGPQSRSLCGFIVWLKEPNNKKGEPLTDAYNPEPSKRRRTICGLPVLGSLQRVQGGWDNGWVYDPEQGASFDAAIELAARDRLTLTGYKGIKFFSKTFTWRRAPADLQRCDQPREARATPGDARAAISPPKTAAQVNAAPQLKAPRPVPAVRPETAQ